MHCLAKNTNTNDYERMCIYTGCADVVIAMVTASFAFHI